MPGPRAAALESPPGAVPLPAGATATPPVVITAAENQALGALLRAFRQRIGLRQTDLARLIHYPRVSLARIEAGHQLVPAGLFARIAHACHVPIEDVWAGGQPNPSRHDWETLWKRLTPHQRTALLNAINAFVSTRVRPDARPNVSPPLPLTTGAPPGDPDDCGCCPPRTP